MVSIKAPAGVACHDWQIFLGRRLQGENDSKLLQLQAALKCGTQCGSCVPELRRLVRQSAAAQDRAEPASA